MLTPDQKNTLRSKGFSDSKIAAFEIKKFGSQQAPAAQPPQKQSFLGDLGGDISQTVTDMSESTNKSQEKIQEATGRYAEGKQGLLSTLYQQAGSAAGGLAGSIGGLTVGLAKSLLPQSAEDKIAEGAKDVITPIVENEQIQGAIEGYQYLPEQFKANLEATVGFGSLGLEIWGAGPGARIVKESVEEGVEQGVKSAVKLAQDVVENVEMPSILKRGARSVDEVFEYADDAARQIDGTPAGVRAAAEAQTKGLNWKEKYVGLTEDQVNRISGMQPEKVAAYIDISQARNISDSVIVNGVEKPVLTPYALGAQETYKAQSVLEDVLKETGGEIGQVRQKLGTIAVPQTSIEAIEQTFKQELSKLKLEIKNGQVIKQSGAQTKVSGSGDMKAIQELYDEILTFKQTPTLTNAIDLRQIFDSKIKFSKRASEVSNDVDPLSRSVRGTIADESATFVGKEAAADLAKYSEFMDAYGDLKAFTDRAAGGEYLLRLVLSGRGDEARQLVQTIKQYTGIDLMDDATMMKVATETFGNKNQKNLFQQEVARAGYDVKALIGGGMLDRVEILGRKALDKFVDPEDVIKDLPNGS